MGDKKMVIDLNGPEGSAFFLLGMVAPLSKELGLDYNHIIDEMISSDYENLLNVFENNFSKFVHFIR
jgi:hypothetical protein